jgi:hypothetical protein
VRVGIMGPGKDENVGKSQSVLIMIDPIIFTRSRTRDGRFQRCLGDPLHEAGRGGLVM